MAERATKRAAGATRIPKTHADAEAALDDRLTSADLTSWTRPELDRVAVDRGLSTAGSDADVRARILADMGV